ncbi:uncharacterized protein L969DRAFT_335172 [Mixia osmundae IAM 14324]|uniref:uncharacterized protein n=1 Tax=Mixia osmundae (strain CBS 9802 / IAM 14324 / JCM 22182 / KY 12970) TaxID=764103 RepID=UPI0004A54FB1|nr:uncharacterized protein L969DRAFT_335172 [Mixia osmundae IAM 14324]KEI40504.1 hypothetical protein L969DRAFT_335172 [Mixia osmundae IAM 14324]
MGRRKACICLLAASVLLSTTVLAQESQQQHATSGSQENLNDLPIKTLVTRAGVLLAAGQGTEALKLYDVALEKDASDYLTRYKRATTYLSLGHSKRALDDLEHVLTLSDFDQARLQIARIRLKAGEFDEAAKAITQFLTKNSSDQPAKDLRKVITDTRNAQTAATQASAKSQWELCIRTTSSAIEHAPSSVELRLLRAGCYQGQGDYEQVTGDLMRAAALQSTNQDLLIRLALMSYLWLGRDSAESLQPVKQCLHYDPDSKSCKTVFRLLKSLEKDMSKARNFVEGNKWNSAAHLIDPKGGSATGLLNKIRETIETYQNDGKNYLPTAKAQRDASLLITRLMQWACKAHTRSDTPRLGLSICEELAKRLPEDVDAMVAKGKDALKREDYEESVRLLSKAFELTGQSDRFIADELQKAQKRLKQSKQRDYYKVLNVSRDADKKTIKRAYRKATLKAHPDKGGSQAAMAAVNQAYEVLGNDGPSYRSESHGMLTR